MLKLAALLNFVYSQLCTKAVSWVQKVNFQGLFPAFPSKVPVKFIKLKTLLTLRIRNGESLNKQKSRFFSLKIASSSEAPLWLFCVLLVDENSSQFSIKLLRPNFWKIHRCCVWKPGELSEINFRLIASCDNEKKQTVW